MSGAQTGREPAPPANPPRTLRGAAPSGVSKRELPRDFVVPARSAMAWCAAALAACLLPLLVAANPPLHDYPFHIARIAALATYAQSPGLQAHYSIGSFLLPNVGMDGLAWALARVMPVEAAGRVFLALMLALQLTGCVALHRVLHRAWSPWPLVSGLFLYNWILLFGFINYLFGIGVLLWATAAWVGMAHGRARPATRLAAGTALTVLLFFCHLIACALFAAIVAGFEIGRTWPLFRRPSGYGSRLQALGELAIGAAIFVAPAALFVASSTADAAHKNVSHTLTNLLRTPLTLVRVLMSGDYLADAVMAVAVVAIAAVLVRRGTLLVARPMVPPLAALVLTYLVVPHELFGGWGADTRIPVAIALVAIAAVQPRMRGEGASALLAGVLAAALLVQAGVRTRAWHREDAAIQEVRSLFAALPDNSVLMIAGEYPVPSLQNIDLLLWQPPLVHVAALAALEGRGIYVPDVFAVAGQQPLIVRPRFAAIDRFQINKPFEVDSTERLRGFAEQAGRVLDDTGLHGPMFVLLLYPERFGIALPSNLALVGEAPRAALLAVRPPAP